MKKHLLFFPVFLCLHFLMAQPYTPMLSTESVWVHSIIGLGFNSNDKIVADSMYEISGRPVYRLQGIQPDFSSEENLGLLQEDSVHKQIHWYAPGTDTLITDSAYLLYDFGMAIGDTGTFTAFDPISYYPGVAPTKSQTRLQLDSVLTDTFLVNGWLPLAGRKLFLSYVDDITFDPIIWREAMGGLTQMMDPVSLNNGNSYLTCFTKDSVREFSGEYNPLPLPDFYCYSEFLLSIDKTPQIAFSISPNPAHHILLVELQDNVSVQHLVLINQAGQKLMQWPVSPGQREVKIPVSSLPPGLYLLQGQGKGRLFAEKFIKQ